MDLVDYGCLDFIRGRFGFLLSIKKVIAEIDPYRLVVDSSLFEFISVICIICKGPKLDA